jgi:hypothetical protein
VVNGGRYCQADLLILGELVLGLLANLQLKLIPVATHWTLLSKIPQYCVSVEHFEESVLEGVISHSR